LVFKRPKGSGKPLFLLVDSKNFFSSPLDFRNIPLAQGKPGKSSANKDKCEHLNLAFLLIAEPSVHCTVSFKQYSEFSPKNKGKPYFYLPIIEPFLGD
jgi:hypothetical protein